MNFAPLRRHAAMLALAAGAALLPVAASAQEAKAPLPGHVIGREDAKLHLAEYVSYTCPHCAHFEADAGEALKILYARPGHVRIEIRHLVRDPVDLAVAMLANCGPPTRFAVNHSVLMKSQDEWFARLRATTPAQRVRYDSGTPTARRQALARDAGLYTIMRTRGYDVTALDRCLADDALAERLANDSAAYIAAGVTGTPSFAIDGELLAATHGWEALKPKLDSLILR